ncbi:tudor and KH domain-containing -like [Brachionus plicatilis]|uniref:Tudor and KH domain-containing-like n=1 Tax=Brachionus plicatilis TaxID=10195 RepID=A0A3M7R7Y1_BRAPC|nr:tudor and KH domain-containing -like [Brachionus plicatilis]
MNFSDFSKLTDYSIDKRKTLICLTVASSITLIYIFKNRNKNSYQENNEEESVIRGKQTIVEIKVPSEFTGQLIGPQGQNIKELQKKTNTRMNFRDKICSIDPLISEADKDSSEKILENPDRILVIRGSNKNVQNAEFEIKKMILEYPIFITKEFFVPQYACGRIIGKGGSTIKELSRASNCKISLIESREISKKDDLDDQDVTSKDLLKIVRIKGSSEKISFAEELIKSKIKEEEALRERKQKGKYY